MKLPHHFNAALLSITGLACAVRLSPAAPDFIGAAISTAILLLLALASLWRWAIHYANRQRKLRRKQMRADLLRRSIYRRASTRSLTA